MINGFGLDVRFSLVMGIIGVVAIARRRLSDIRLIEKGFGWLLLGTLYGIIVGFLSPLPMTPTGLGPALGMMASHALAEQLFFTGFVGLSLLDRTPSPAMALLITAALFGLHQLTFFATLSLPPSVMLTGVLQMTAFAGGAYAFLMWRTNGILAPYSHKLQSSASWSFAVSKHTEANGIMSKRLILCIDSIGLEGDLRQGFRKAQSKP